MNLGESKKSLDFKEIQNYHKTLLINHLLSYCDGVLSRVSTPFTYHNFS